MTWSGTILYFDLISIPPFGRSPESTGSVYVALNGGNFITGRTTGSFNTDWCVCCNDFS